MTDLPPPPLPAPDPLPGRADDARDDAPVTSEPPAAPAAPTDAPPAELPEPFQNVARERSPDLVTVLVYGGHRFQDDRVTFVVLGVLAMLAQFVLFAVGQLATDRVAITLLVDLGGAVVTSVLALGLYRAALMVTAGERPTIGGALRYDRWGEWIAFSIVFGLMVGVGIELYVVPGVLLLAFFGLAPLYFIDGGLHLGDALRASRRAVADNGLPFALTLLGAILAGALGALVCLVGAFVTVPIAHVAVAYLYRFATGTSVAE